MTLQIYTFIISKKKYGIKKQFFLNLQNVNNLQKQEKDQQILFPECFLSFPGSKNISSFDKLWMCLYCKLRDLCLDTRPSVRKSSGKFFF